jgi:hypothetical protein
MLRIAVLMAVLCGMLAAGAAKAQLGAIFGDSPPRPPGDIPNSAFPTQPPPVHYPGPAPLPAPSPAPPPSGIEAQPLPPPPGATMAPQPQVPSQGAGLTPPGPGPLIQPVNPPPPQPADTSPQPDDTVVTETPTQKIDNGRVVFSGLDKITGRIISFDAAIGETVQFGALRVMARVCYTRPPTEATNTDAFVEVDEVTLQGEVKRIFTGWMFAASPGLHAVEHPIYDVWLTDCASPLPTRVAQPAAPTASMGPQIAAPAPRAPAPPRTRQAAPARAQPAPPVTPSPAVAPTQQN